MNDFTLADQDLIGLMIFKNLQIRTGSDSILSDQDWTWTENFHSPLISDVQSNILHVKYAEKTDGLGIRV